MEKSDLSTYNRLFALAQEVLRKHIDDPRVACDRVVVELSLDDDLDDITAPESEYAYSDLSTIYDIAIRYEDNDTTEKERADIWQEILHLAKIDEKQSQQKSNIDTYDRLFAITQDLLRKHIDDPWFACSRVLGKLALEDDLEDATSSDNDLSKILDLSIRYKDKNTTDKERTDIWQEILQLAKIDEKQDHKT